MKLSFALSLFSSLKLSGIVPFSLLKLRSLQEKKLFPYNHVIYWLYAIEQLYPDYIFLLLTYIYTNEEN